MSRNGGFSFLRVFLEDARTYLYLTRKKSKPCCHSAAKETRSKAREKNESEEFRMKNILAALALLLGGCHGYPQGLKPVEGFALKPYLGVWYELARLDHSFEKGLDNVTAIYRLRDDGSLEVVNRGYRKDKGEWKTAKGKAKFATEPQLGHLLVSFFGPFYGSYLIFYLDQDYQNAFVTGANTSYLWWLSRTREIDEETKEIFLEKAAAAGFAVEELIFVEHDRPQPQELHTKENHE